MRVTYFTEVIREWGNTWLWEDLSWTGNEDQIVDLIREGTCVAVADDSYMDNLYRR